MGHYIKIEAAAKKYLFSLETDIRRRIMQAIEKLSTVSRPIGCKKLKGWDAYRIRVGNYRIIYEINDNTLVVLIVRIAHRRESYK